MAVLHTLVRRTGIVAIGFASLVWHPRIASADTIIDTTAIDSTHTDNPINAWGVDGTKQYGQVITAPTTDTVLNSFSFTFNATGSFTFDADVMAWSGTSPTGSLLFHSPQTTTDVGSDHTYTINTGGLNLTAGGQYVLFFDARNGTGSGNAVMEGRAGDPYLFGGFVDSDIFSSQPLTNTWDVSIGSSGVDAAFVANFSSVPAPSAAWGCGVLLMGSGLMALMRRRVSSVRAL